MEYDTYDTIDTYHETEEAYDDMNAGEGGKTKVQMQIHSRIRKNKDEILDKENSNAVSELVFAGQSWQTGARI